MTSRHLVFLSLILQLFISLCCDIYAQNFETGLESLAASGFEILQGKNVGLITNPTGVGGGIIEKWY